MAYTVMACTVITYIGIAHIVMAFIVMAYTVVLKVHARPLEHMKHVSSAPSGDMVLRWRHIDGEDRIDPSKSAI